MPSDETSAPPPPENLGDAGRALWLACTDDIEFDSHELPQLAMACAQADMIAMLEDALSEDGVLTAGSKGQTRVSGAVVELRQSRLALSRLLRALDLPGGDEQLTPGQLRARRASEARWSKVRGPRAAS